MNGKMKMLVGIALVLGALSVAFFATPIKAYVNRDVNGDLLQTQDRDRLRTQDYDGNDDVFQTQERENLRTQNRESNCDCTQTQYRSRQKINQCATNRTCNCTMNLERCRHQNR